MTKNDFVCISALTGTTRCGTSPTCSFTLMARFSGFPLPFTRCPITIVVITIVVITVVIVITVVVITVVFITVVFIILILIAINITIIAISNLIIAIDIFIIFVFIIIILILIFVLEIISITRSLGALRAPTSSWRPFGPLAYVLHALRALRPCDPRVSGWIVLLAFG